MTYLTFRFGGLIGSLSFSADAVPVPFGAKMKRFALRLEDSEQRGASLVNSLPCVLQSRFAVCDTRAKERAWIEYGIGYCNLTTCCRQVCPEFITITENAIVPLKERVDDFFDLFVSGALA